MSSASVTGPQPRREPSDIPGVDQADVNRPARTADGATFSDLLNETMQKSSQPTPGIAQTGVSQNVDASHCMSRGKIMSTGNPLHLAIEGEGCFVLTNGQRDVYTRAGAFAVDANINLVDPATGYRVKRVGAEGEIDGFQTPGCDNIRIPYGKAMPPRATSEVAVSGNLGADAPFSALQTQKLASDLVYTHSAGTAANDTTRLHQLDQCGETFISGEINFSGNRNDGTPLDRGLCLGIDRSTTLGDVINHLNTKVLDGSTASLVNGRIRITDDAPGYSQTDIAMSYSGEGSLATPAYFEISTPGTEASGSVDITVYDSHGDKHALSGAFVKTNTTDTWDMALTSVTGDVSEITMPGRRIKGISFDASNGSFKALSESNPARFVVTFANDASNPQTIRMNMGTPGRLDGLTQFAGNSTAAAKNQNGYGPGKLSAISVNNKGTVVGRFSNGVKKDIAAVQIATFQDTSALERIANGYYVPSAASGAPVAGRAMAGGTGAIRSGALEKSDSDVAADFVNMLQAQDGYKANDTFRELTNFIA